MVSSKRPGNKEGKHLPIWCLFFGRYRSGSFSEFISCIAYHNAARSVPWLVSVLLMIRTPILPKPLLFFFFLPVSSQCLQNTSYDVDPQNVSI